MRTALALIALATLDVLLCSPPVLALDPSLDVSQYAHKSWKVREGFFNSSINTIEQTPDGYLWIGTDFGLYRFDGVRSVPWQPGRNESLPSNVIRKLFVSHDGTLWIGTAKGLASWKDGKLTLYPELPAEGVDAVAEDGERTVWVGLEDIPAWRLCAIKKEAVQCFGDKGTLGLGEGTLLSDKNGNIWAGTGTGLWRWRAGSPQSISLSGPVSEVHAVIEDDQGAVLISTRGGIIRVFAGNTTAYRLPGYDQQFNPFSLLRDRDGGLWIATRDRGLLHVHQGRTDHFGKSDGLASNSIADLFEDKEGNIWVGTSSGLDSFHELAVSTMADRQGFSSASVESVLTARDGSVWLGTRNGLDRWEDGRLSLYRKRCAPLPPTARQIIDPGLPDDFHSSLYQDHRGRIWTFSRGGAAYLDERGRFMRVPGLPGGFAHSIAEDSEGDFWISQDQGFFHLLRGGKVEQIPWAKLGGQGLAFALASDPSRGGLWLGFFRGGVAYFRGGQVRQWYAEAEGLGQGRVNQLQVDPEGTLWAGTEGGLSRLKSGRINTLTSQNGLPCNAVHEFAQDNAQSLWLNTACGLVRIARSELEAWVRDPKLKIQATVFDSYDGLTPQGSPRGLSPRMGKSTDGKIWLVSGDGVSVIDPQHLPFNRIPPPVYIERIVADGKIYTPAAGNRRLRLPPLVHNLTIDYTGLSFTAPEKVRFRFKLEGQDSDWREVVNDREVQYSNLAPKHYQFRVMACNNSGAWNEEGATLDFVVPPAWFQTNWFRALCAAILLALLWVAYQFRVHQLQRESKQLREVIDTIPGSVWSALPDGSVDFINRRWLDFSGVSLEEGLGRGWEAAVHPDDLARFVDEWRAAVASGKAMETEARVRRADGQYRWLLIRNVPLRDQGEKIVKWYGTSTDIDDRKRAEQALSRSNRELRALSNCNQTLLRATDEQSLLEEICRIVCEEAGYRMAWVAYAEHDTAKSVRPVAWTGAEKGYLANLGITWADTERGWSPTGTAIRSGKTCCIQDFTTDARLAPWRESVLQHRFLSGIALPLKDEHASVFGSLSLYSAQPNAFTSEEIRLLEELAADLAFGIVTLRSRAARQRAEEEVARLSFALDKVREAAFLIDDRGRFHYVNEEACRVLGYTRAQLLGMGVSEIDPEFPAERWSDHWRNLKAQRSLGFESRHRTRDGRTFPVEISANYFEYGGRAYNLALVRDISDRKRAEEALLRSEAYLADAQRLSHTGSWALDVASDKYAYCSEECLRIYGFDPQEGLPTREAVFRRIHPEDRNRVEAIFEKALREKVDSSDELRMVLPDGTVKWVHVIRHPVLNDAGDIVTVIGTSVDITERKRAEEALRRSEFYLAEGQRLSHTGSWALDVASDKYAYCSEECLRIYGFDPQEGLPTREAVFGRILREDLDRVTRSFEKSLREKADSSGELRIVLPDGTVKDIYVIRHPVLNDAGDVVQLVGTSIDITERKHAEEALRESETRFRTFVDHAADAFLMLDDQGTIIDVNRSACESLGCTRQELMGMTPMAFDVNPDRAPLESVAERTAAGETVLFDRHWHRRKDGSLFPVEVQTSVIWHGGRRFLLKVARDISDRVRAEEEHERLHQLEMDLAHINRVSMLGELAASIAHEVNQPLSGVVSNGSACLRWLAGDAPNVEEAQEAARRIVRDGKRAGEVIARVRALTKRAATPREKLDMNETIRDVLALVGDEAKRKGVMIQTQFPADLSTISGDRVQLQQVLLNLVVNAIEAMSSVEERPRELLITTRNLEAGQVQVTVKDTGPGIDPNALDKIFDPFYTTKPGGMGMGLSISRSILQAHGGRLWAAAKDGPGTIFHFTVPKYREEESNAAA
jgi:PAS domain S-box-containing protein